MREAPRRSHPPRCGPDRASCRSMPCPDLRRCGAETPSQTLKLSYLSVLYIHIPCLRPGPPGAGRSVVGTASPGAAATAAPGSTAEIPESAPHRADRRFRKADYFAAVPFFVALRAVFASAAARLALFFSAAAFSLFAVFSALAAAFTALRADLAGLAAALRSRTMR